MGQDQQQKVPKAPAGARRQWAADRAMRPPMRSPGRPEPSRAVQRHFWQRIASGVTTAEAAVAVGVSCPVGTRWFRHAGGMPPISLDEPTGRYLSFAEREEIALLRAQEFGVREIARRTGRDAGTISRELRRNAATRGGKPVYRALVAQWKAQQAAKRPKTAKLAGDERLREYVQERLMRQRPSPRRHDRHRAKDAWVERAEQAASAGQAVGDGMEPGADLAPAPCRLPR